MSPVPPVTTTPDEVLIKIRYVITLHYKYDYTMLYYNIITLCYTVCDGMQFHTMD